MDYLYLETLKKPEVFAKLIFRVQVVTFLIVALLLAGRTFSQPVLSEKSFSLNEVQVKPRVLKVWVQKGKPPLLPRLLHYVQFCDSNGKQLPPITYYNKVEIGNVRTIQVAVIETKLEPFENDSFDVFFVTMQIVGTDTFKTRKLVLGKDIRKKHHALNFSPGELTLLPQPVYLGFQLVPNKISTLYRYDLHTAAKNVEFYYYRAPLQTIVRWTGEFGLTLNFRMQYYEL